MKPLSVEEAADFMRLPLSTFRRMAAAEKIPKAKVGRRVIYLDDDLVVALKNMQNRPAAAEAEEKTLCLSTNVVAFGGAISEHQTALDLDAACAPRSKRTR